MIRPVIVFASFGASTQEMHEKSIAPIIREIGKAFPNFVIVEAYTSAFIRRRLKNEGIEMLSLEEQLEELCQKGVREVYVQPAHLTPGEEYEKRFLKRQSCFMRALQYSRLVSPSFSDRMTRKMMISRAVSQQFFQILHRMKKKL